MYLFEWAYIHNKNPFSPSEELPTREPQRTVFNECYDAIHFDTHYSDEEIKIVNDDINHSFSAAGWAFWIENSVKNEAFSSLCHDIEKLPKNLNKNLLKNLEIYKNECRNSISYVYIEHPYNTILYDEYEEEDEE